jgi:PAS domain S-box-containing protein
MKHPRKQGTQEEVSIEGLLEEIETLRRRIAEFEADEAFHSRSEQELGRRTEELERRIGEANCLYEVSRLLADKAASSEEITRKVGRELLSSLSRSGDRQVRVAIGSHLFESQPPRPSTAAFCCEITINGSQFGLLEIHYDTRPLGEREKQLATDVAGLLARIIEQKRTEKTILENERSFRTLVENSPTGIFIVQNGQVVYENPEEKRLSGPLVHLFRDGDLSGIHPADMKKVEEGFKKIVAGEERNLDIDFRFLVTGPADTVPERKWVHCRASLIDYMGGEAILVNKLDVTRTKELEFLLRAEDKMASLGRVTSGIAHEIRNPLSGINIYLSNLERMISDDRDGSKEKAKEIIGQLRSASDRIESVIRRVMDFAKPREPKFAKISINQSVLNAVNFSSTTLRKAGVHLTMALAEDLPFCNADPHLMEQVILNLITNAKDAMRQAASEKVIRVTSAEQDGRIIVTVSDSGPGVPLHMRKRIFDPFYTTKDGGTGIGLSLCHRIIVDHGGTLTVDNKDSGGAEFKIELPLDGEYRKMPSDRFLYIRN